MSKEERTSTQELVQYRERLFKQKEYLINLLSKIEKQILALQVERLHLKNSLLGTGLKRDLSANTAEECKNIKDEPTDNRVPENLMEQKLDLSIPASLNNFEEEIEDDEITEDEKQILDQLDMLI